LRLPGAETSLHFVRRPDDAPSKGPVLVFMSDNLPLTVQALRSQGVRIVKDVAPAPYDPRRQVAEIDDSEGNRIVISSP
jgi:predicted enzyme related to lactoylglutathione lyase